MTSGLRGSETVPKIVGSLRYHGLEVVVYDKVESNPKDYNVMEAVALYQENKCDSFISIGGGSSHDACKGARISVAHDGRSVNEFEGSTEREPQEPAAHRGLHDGGTGSETSWAYVITDTTTNPNQPHKYVAFDDAAVATLAVDDPTLYYDCPVDYTAQCGFDVLAHASEPYVSRLNFPPSLGNALYAIKLTAENLRQATWNPQDLPGREGMITRSTSRPGVNSALHHHRSPRLSASNLHTLTTHPPPTPKASTRARTPRTRRTSRSRPRQAPALRPPGPTSLPTRRPIRTSRTSTSPSTTRPSPRSRSTTRPCTTTARSTTRRSAASTCSPTPASLTCPG